MKQPKLVIIGGGATGTGIANEASHRGLDVVLIERGKIGQGTSGHFHGVLHSGARYAVNDPVVAAECYIENQRLRKIIPSAIVDTGGLFIALTPDEVNFSKKLVDACNDARIPINEITVAQALQLEPRLNPKLLRTFTVPDGFIDGAEVMRLNKERALQSGSSVTFMTNHTVIGFERAHSRITGVEVYDTVTNEKEIISCDYVVSAAGVWAGQVANKASVELEMLFDKGTMIVFDEPLTSKVLNRCRPEDDGDLLVPDGIGHSIMGTTSRIITDPDESSPSDEEVDVLLNEGAQMIPDIVNTRVSRTYAGVRPLLRTDELDHAALTRTISRSFQVIDHADQGINNFVSVVGGKITLYRKMAESTVNCIEAKLSS